MAPGALPLILGSLVFAGLAWLLWHISAEMRQWQLGQPSRRAVDHDLVELGRVVSREIAIEDAQFQVRGKDGVLVDDPDAARVAALEDSMRAHPVKGPIYP